MPNLKKIIFAFTLVFLLPGCMEKKTNDAVKTYKYWAGSKPPADMQVLNGKYWESANWSKEYILFMKFIPSKIWWDEFVEQNNLVIDEEDHYSGPLAPEWCSTPEWFQPSKKSIRYKHDGDFHNDSRIFRDAETDTCYIFEEQL